MNDIISQIRSRINLDAPPRYDAEAGVWVGTCKELNVRSQGTSEDEARLALDSAVSIYLKHRCPRGLIGDIAARLGLST
jgi:predicted RNase H-like HicB family nuclease